MKTITQHTRQPQQSNHARIHDAFVVLLEHLGPEKTLQLWHLFFPPQEAYLALPIRDFSEHSCTFLVGTA
jgi:hypothetical protein